MQKQKATDDGRRATDQTGFTLLELIVTLTVLAIMVFATLPLAQNAHKRQKEQELREALREIRLAIDEFKRDTYGACPQGNNPVPPPGGGLGGNNVPTDPRSRVVIDDCTIFDSENVDRYPPTLETLVDGVKVKARGLNIKTGGGVFNNKESVVFDDAPKELKKVYLRELPVDPMTGKAEWRMRSSYQEKGTDSWDDINVFDVRSTSDEEALNGEKYSDW
ncbi:MAG TPA: type II secretion system protein [Pyrinomonadaceae bacterium]